MAQPTIPGYSIVDRLGSGGFATVYLATSTETGENVAIKVLHEHTNNPDDLLRFEREQTTMLALNGHPNIVGILDSGITDDEQHFSVLEYVDGGSVRDRIDGGGGALHWANVVEIGVQICAALDIAHRSGVLHRDVKPANILLQDNFAKLGDFGIARLIGQSQVTAAQSIIGTLAYTPPEVFHNKPFDGRGDIYQLGVSLYEMLLGRAPFTSAAADNKATIIRRILDHPAPPLAQFDVPQPLSDLLDEVLAKDPADRPQTAESFGRRLNEVEATLGRTPTKLSEDTQLIAQQTATIDNPVGPVGSAVPVSPIVADGDVWPRSNEVAAEEPVAPASSAESLVRQSAEVEAEVKVESTPPTVDRPIDDSSDSDALPERPVSNAPVSEPAVRVAPEPAAARPEAPVVEPPFDANVTVAEPRTSSPTSLISNQGGSSAMSLGTPGPAPAHFDSPARRAPAATRPADAAPAAPRRWPWALLVLALIGAGVAGVIAAQWSNSNDNTPASSDTATDDGTSPDTPDDQPDETPQIVAFDDPAFLEPNAEHSIIFDVVRNPVGLTMVGAAGDGESASQQQPVVWTIGNDGAAMQRAFETGGRLWSIGVSADDFLAVGDVADGQTGTDGLATIGVQASALSPTVDPTFTGAEDEALFASAFDPSMDPPGFLVGGSRNADGAATMGLWQVARPSDGEDPTWLAIPVGSGNPGAINDIAVNGSIGVAVGVEQIDGDDVGVVLIRRQNGTWSNLIAPRPSTRFHGVVIAGERIVVVGESGASGATVPIAIVSDTAGERPLLHQLPLRASAGVARNVAEVLDGRVIIVGDTPNDSDASGRIGAIWELLPADDFADDLWTTRASADLPTDSFTELWAVDEWNDTVYVFGRTEVDGRRPAGAWILNLDG